MIVEKELLSELRRIFSLNLYEVKIWAGLLSKGSASAGELSDISTVPRSRTYDILQSLEKKGFIVMQAGKPIKYAAVNPSEVVERVKKSTLAEAEERVKNLEQVRTNSVVKKIEDLFSKGIEHVDVTSFTGVIKGRENVYNHLSTLIKNATKNVTIITTKEGLIRKSAALNSVLKNAKKRGVAIKISAPMEDAKLKGIANFKKAKEDTNRVVIIDNKDVVMMVTDDQKIHPAYDSAVWISSPYVAKSMEKLYDKL